VIVVGYAGLPEGHFPPLHVGENLSINVLRKSLECHGGVVRACDSLVVGNLSGRHGSDTRRRRTCGRSEWFSSSSSLAAIFAM